MKSKHKLILIAFCSIIVTGIVGILVTRDMKKEQTSLEELEKSYDTETSSWSETKQVSIPKILTGMTPVIFTDGEKEATVASKQDIADHTWYDYTVQATSTEQGGTSKWANVMLKDGSLFVWIPRYAYKIVYEDETDYTKSGTIDIIFLKGNTNLNADDVDVTTLGYKIHPAFQDGTKNDFANGEWNKEIEGFWVAKFEPGYSNIEGTASSQIERVNTELIYEETGNNIYGPIIAGETKLAYPVFIGEAYTYNLLEVGQMLNLAKSLAQNGNPYGLDEQEADTHMAKNAEWGAIAYLAHSQYGRNGTKITSNNLNVSFAVENSGGATGYAATNGLQNIIGEYDGTLKDHMNTSDSWYTEIGKLASTTGNLYGIYDLVGGAWEYTAANNAEIASTHDHGNNENSFVQNEKSTPYWTVYSVAGKDSSRASNYEANRHIYGDATFETSQKGNSYTSFNGETSIYIQSTAAFFLRGGDYTNARFSGIFAFSSHSGHESEAYSFRAIIIGR